MRAPGSREAGGPARVRHERREFVVVGGGLLGLATAHALGGLGRDVVCLERSCVGNEDGGSKGTARIFRLGYDDPLYVSMALRAEQGWRQLEASFGEPLIAPCDVLNFGEGLAELMEALQAAAGVGAGAGAGAGKGGDGISPTGAPELISSDEVARRFPGLAIEGPALVDPSGGVLRADRALEAFRSTMRAELREHVTVTAVRDEGNVAKVHTSAGVLEAPVVVVCAGAGSQRLLATAGIACHTSATLEQVAYFGFSTAGPVEGGRERLLPAVIERLGVGSGGRAWTAPGGLVDIGAIGGSPGAAGGSPSPGEWVEQLALYGLPTPANGWYKMGIHHTGPEADPDDAYPEPDPAFTERLAIAAASIIRGIDPSPRLVERCVYDNTEDGNFVIDRIGRIVVGAGTSGHGFKFGPLLGSLLADLARGSEPELELTRFSARRSAVADRRRH